MRQDDTPLLQAEKFQELFDDFGDEADDVIAEWAQETERGIAELRVLLDGDGPDLDADAVQSVAHRLKGGCMMVGAQRLQGVAMALDALAKQGADPGEIRALAPGLLDAWEQTRARLASHLPKT